MDFNNGVIITWGYVINIAYNVPVYFPITYTTLVRMAISTINDGYMFINIPVVINSYFTTRSTLSNTQNTTGTVMWISIGF